MKTTIIAVAILLILAPSCFAGETSIKIPGVEIVTDGTGSSVKVPGVDINTADSGTIVSAPGVNVVTSGETVDDPAKNNAEDTVINADDGILTVIGRGQSMTINGDNNNIVVDGFVQNIFINGDANIIDAKELVTSVNLTGDKNTVLLPTPPSNASVQMVDLGEYNKLQYR